MPLSWERPVSSEYPKLWHKFTVLGETYFIQDLPQSMTEEAIEFTRKYLFKDEPLSSAYNLYENPFFLDHCDSIYRTEIIKQKAALVCFKEGSSEIVGINFNYVTSNADTFDLKDTLRSIYSTCQRLYRLCTDKNYTLRSLINVHRNFGRCRAVCELVRQGATFHADEILSSAGLCVSPEYRGRGIGQQILKTRIQFCREFNITLTRNVFTSVAGDKCAANAGFNLDKKLSYNTIRESYPQLKLPRHIRSDAITYRSMKIDQQ